MRITYKQFTNGQPMAAAVIRQIGGWQSFTESAQDITNHGVDGGFHGFIYHTDTVAFARRNLASIRSVIEQLADDFGEDPAKMIQSWKCIGTDYSTTEINTVLYRGKCADKDAETQILNGLAWFAAEHVARNYADQTESA